MLFAGLRRSGSGLTRLDIAAAGAGPVRRGDLGRRAGGCGSSGRGNPCRGFGGKAPPRFRAGPRLRPRRPGKSRSWRGRDRERCGRCAALAARPRGQHHPYRRAMPRRWSANSRHFAGIGIDAERVGGVTRDLWPRLFTAAEQDDVRAQADPLLAATLLFSAKEASYKAWALKGALAFREIEVVAGSRRFFAVHAGRATCRRTCPWKKASCWSPPGALDDCRFPRWAPSGFPDAR